MTPSTLASKRRDGTSAGAEFVAFVVETLGGMGYDVRVNDPYKVANCPAHFTGADVGARPWVAGLGQHNEEIFVEVGLSTGG